MRYCGLDILRGFAAFFIVGCHIILPSRTDSAGMLMHFCNMFVGVFGVISGFLLGESIAKGRSMKQQIVRRCARLLPIYFAWSILYVLVSLGFGLIEHNGDKIARLWDYGYWAGVIFYGGASCHLWYVSSLFYGTLVIIIISKVVRRGASFLLLGGCAIAISTYLGKCHFALYELRLLGFMLTGYWLRIETKDCKNTGEYRVLLVWLVFTILLHVMLRDVIHGFVRDWFVAIPLVKLFLGYDISVKLPKLKKHSLLWERIHWEYIWFIPFLLPV